MLHKDCPPGLKGSLVPCGCPTCSAHWRRCAAACNHQRCSGPCSRTCKFCQESPGRGDRGTVPALSGYTDGPFLLAGETYPALWTSLGERPGLCMVSLPAMGAGLPFEVSVANKRGLIEAWLQAGPVQLLCRV